MESLRPVEFLVVVSGVKALVVEFPANRDPVGLVNAPAVPAVRTLRKGTGDLDPPSLFPCNGSNFLGNLQKILILAHDKGHVVCATMSKCRHVERDPHVDPLLLSYQSRVLGAIGQSHPAVLVPKWSAIHDDPLSSHGRELARPEEMPSGVVAGIGNPGVEAHLGQLPSLAPAHLPGKGPNVVVGFVIAERFASSVKQVLAVHEGDGTLGRRRVIHWSITKNNPISGPSACRMGSKQPAAY